MKHLALASALVCAALSVSCKVAQPPPTTARPRVEGEVIATVNGVPLTRQELPPSAHGQAARNGAAGPVDGELLSRLVEDEVLAQYAVTAGLDRDATYRAELARAEAGFRAWRRSQLVALADRSQSTGINVTEAEARAWYEAHSARARAEVRVAQILVRDEAAATQMLAELRSGVAFDDVARRLAPPGDDPTARPWELGPLRWHQLPDAWRGPVDGLQVGQISDVIRGPNRRFWIVKVLERRENPSLTFETTRDTIVQVLRDERAIAARARLRETLRRAANVAVTPQPPPPSDNR